MLRALRIRITLYGHDNGDVVLTQNNLAVVLKTRDTSYREVDRLARSKAAVTIEVANIIKGK